MQQLIDGKYEYKYAEPIEMTYTKAIKDLYARLHSAKFKGNMNITTPEEAKASLIKDVTDPVEKNAIIDEVVKSLDAWPNVDVALYLAVARIVDDYRASWEEERSNKK